MKANPSQMKTNQTQMKAYQSQVASGRDGFAQLMHAEWTKFRTVRAWVIGVSVAGSMFVLFSFLVAQGSHSADCTSAPDGNGEVCTGAPALPVGPGGEAVTDSYYFVNRTLTGDGTITARVTSLTGVRDTGATAKAGQSGGPREAATPDLESWAKAGLIVTTSTDPGAAYAAIMVTGDNGVRMQYDYTHDIAGLSGATIHPLAALVAPGPPRRRRHRLRLHRWPPLDQGGRRPRSRVGFERPCRSVRHLT